MITLLSVVWLREKVDLRHWLALFVRHLDTLLYPSIVYSECQIKSRLFHMNVWSPRGQTPIVRVDAGRSKAGFYGTLNLKTGQEIVTRSPVFNADATAHHLQQVLDAFLQQPILFFWDRAPWHHGEPIQRLLAANPRLEIMNYPVAAPELNPQDQVWKQTRRAVSHNHLTPKLPQLADRFENHLRSNQFDSSFLERYGYHLVCPFLN